MKSARPRVIAGNWKMNKTVEEALAFVRDLLPQIEGNAGDVLLAVPFTAIYPLAQAAEGSRLLIGAQNMNDASEGAYTGEVAALMLIDAGAKFVLLGHSERRHLFGESDEWIHKKVVRAVKDGIAPLLCIGETLLERGDGRTKEVLERQLLSALSGLSAEELASLRIAYEPVWAIGTGETATPSLAQEAHSFIRSWLSSHLSKEFADKTPLLYGGSVTPENSRQLLEEADIDGLLIGGASLSLDSFVKIVHDSTF